MKKTILTITASLLTVAAFGQGIVNFSNASSTPGWANPTFDRYVRWDAIAPAYNPSLIPGGLVSSNYAGLNLASLRAALYYAASTQNDVNLFTAAAGGPTTFKVSTSTTAGSWFGGNRTLDFIPPGSTANLIVIVWDSNLSNDPLSAAACGGLGGRSSVFQYTPPTNPQAQPSDFLMTGLTAFNVGLPCSPEPSTLGLAAIGAAALLILRRSKNR
jgi:hypothetical protein